MPSGAAVAADYRCMMASDCLLDIAVYPTSDDAEHSEGLCGNYNGVCSDDIIPKGSTALVDIPQEPVTFTGSYTYVL